MIRLLTFLLFAVTLVAADGGYVGGFLGVNHISDAGGNHFIFGANGSANLTNTLGAYVQLDHTYVRGGGLTDFDGGLVANFPRGGQLQPYFLGGIGLGHASGYNSFSVDGGVGLRIFLGRNWGINPEVKVYRYTRDSGFTAVRVTGGVFYQFGH